MPISTGPVRCLSGSTPDSGQARGPAEAAIFHKASRSRYSLIAGCRKSDRPRYVFSFLGRDESEMALREKIPAFLRNDSKYGNPAIPLDRFPEHHFVPFSRNLVQDDPGNIDLGIEVLASQNQSCSRSRHLGCIQNDNHRASEKLGQFGGREAAVCVHPVIEAAVSFDQTPVAFTGMTHK